LRKKKERRKEKEKVKKVDQKKQNWKNLVLESTAFLSKREVIVVIFCYFFIVFFLKSFAKLKNKLRTVEPRCWKKIKNNPASF